METIKELMHGRTTLIVTHRLATVHNVDRIVVLEHGRIRRAGTRDLNSLARGGVYAKLYSAGNFPLMSNVDEQRRVEDDWWQHPIPPNVVFGEGFYCETRRSSVSCAIAPPPRSSLAIMFPVMPVVRLRSAKTARARSAISLFSTAHSSWPRSELRSARYCLISWNVGIADSDFHPLEPAQRLVDALALAPFLQGSPAAPPAPHRSRHHRGQCLDRHERDRFSKA